jgi:transcriptional regulator with XRE-family HTH domain
MALPQDAEVDNLFIRTRGIVSTKKLSIREIKAARALLGWSQDDLAAHSGVSQPTIGRLEAEGGEIGGRVETEQKIRRALEKAGIEFLNGDQPGVRLKKRRA